MTRYPKTATETCPHCSTTHELPVEMDEDGPYVELDTEVCNDDHCTRKLCSECPQFRCEGCSLVFCEEHKRVYPSAEADTGESLCDECWKWEEQADKEAVAEKKE